MTTIINLTNLIQKAQESQIISRGKKREKRPDQLLYSVRSKVSKGDDLNKSQLSNAPLSSRGEKADENSPRLKQDKDILEHLEDDKSSISNVSTAISDRLKNFDDENKLELAMDRPLQSESSQIKKDDPHLLFELALESEKPSETIKIYDNEEDYDIFLDNVCLAQNVRGELALHFKIYVLRVLKDIHPKFLRIEPLFNKLLDINYKLMMCENNRMIPDESLLPYIDSGVIQSLNEAEKSN
jgi:hypothetical protein